MRRILRGYVEKLWDATPFGWSWTNGEVRDFCIQTEVISESGASIDDSRLYEYIVGAILVSYGVHRVHRHLNGRFHLDALEDILKTFKEGAKNNFTDTSTASACIGVACNNVRSVLRGVSSFEVTPELYDDIVSASLSRSGGDIFRNRTLSNEVEQEVHNAILHGVINAVSTASGYLNEEHEQSESVEAEIDVPQSVISRLTGLQGEVRLEEQAREGLSRQEALANGLQRQLNMERQAIRVPTNGGLTFGTVPSLRRTSTEYVQRVTENLRGNDGLGAIEERWDEASELTEELSADVPPELIEHMGQVQQWNFRPNNFVFRDVINNEPIGSHVPDNKALYLGVEIEMATHKSPVDDNHIVGGLKHLDGDDKFLLFKFDRSIVDHNGRGVECVTEPATLDYHTHYDWDRVLGMARKDFKCRSHNANNCGIHVHINRGFLNKAEETKLSLFVRHNVDQFKAISRRSESSYARYGCKKSDTIADYVHSEERYQAMNFQNCSSIEFRMFRGTLNTDTFMATLQFVDAVVRFMKHVSSADIVKGNSWELFCKHLENNNKSRRLKNRYATLNAYLKTKELLVNERMPF